MMRLPFKDITAKRNVTIGRLALYWIGWLCLAVFLLLLARWTTVRFAVVIGAVAGFLILAAFEILSRRHWERTLLSKLDMQDKEYTRLVREIARNRNEMAQLKKGLADTGRAAAKAAEGRLRNSVEERMLTNIANQLTYIGTMARPEADMDALDALGREDVLTPRASARHYDAGDSGLRAIPEIAPPGIEDERVLKLLRDAVDEDRIDIFMQPVVSLPQRKLRFYELLSRIRMDRDEYIPARRYINLALRENLLPAIDNLLLLRALQMVRDMDPAGTGERGYFCNISPTTLSDAKFMGDLVEFISQHRHLASRLTFELSQRDILDAAVMTPAVEDVLNGLARLGCRFSMDGVETLPLDIGALAARHIRYVKLEAPFLMRKFSERGGFHRIRRLKTDMDRQGIDMIVTHIEREKELVELLDLDIDYGQGYLFGEPEKSLHS